MLWNNHFGIHNWQKSLKCLNWILLDRVYSCQFLNFIQLIMRKRWKKSANSSQFLKNPLIMYIYHTIENQFWTWNYCLVLCGSDCQFTILLYVCEIRDKSLICHILKRIAARDLMSRNFSLVLWTLKLFVSFGTLQFNMNCL